MFRSVVFFHFMNNFVDILFIKKTFYNVYILKFFYQNFFSLMKKKF